MLEPKINLSNQVVITSQINAEVVVLIVEAVTLRGRLLEAVGLPSNITCSLLAKINHLRHFVFTKCSLIFQAIIFSNKYFGQYPNTFFFFQIF